MSLLLLSTLYNKKGGSIVGYRILDTDSKNTMNVPVDNFIKVIQSNQAVVDNVKVEANRVIGTNGSIERYPKCTVNNRLIDSKASPIIIINKVGDFGYTVSDYKGTIKVISEADAIAYAEKAGIANGKIVPSETGTFISAISGTYPVIPDTISDKLKANQNKTDTKPVETKQEIKEEPKDTPQKPSIIDIFTQEQRDAINEYYAYYLKSQLADGNKKDDIDKTMKSEIETIAKVLKSSVLAEYNAKYSKFFYIATMVGSTDKFSELTSDEFTKHFWRFIKLGLPMPESMAKEYNNYLKNNFFRFMDVMYKGLPEALDEIQNKWRWTGVVPYLTTMQNYVRKFPGQYEDVQELTKYMKVIEFLCINSKLFEDTYKKLDITYLDMFDTLNNYTDCRLSTDEVIFIAQMMVFSNKNACQDAINKLAGLDKAIDLQPRLFDTNTVEIMERFFTDCINFKYGVNPKPVDTTTLEEKFNDAYKNNHQNNDESKSTSGIDDLPPWDTGDTTKTVEEPTTKTTKAIKSEQPEDEGYTRKPDNMTLKEWFNWLIQHNNVDESHISIEIAKDIFQRNISYDRLSSKQRFRIDDAIKICEKANNERLGIKSEKKQKPKYRNKTSTISDEDNITYNLEDHPDIKKKVERIILKADSVEMQEVLEKSPNVIKICYSILRGEKATTRQLRHVNLAIDILDNQ